MGAAIIILAPLAAAAQSAADSAALGRALGAAAAARIARERSPVVVVRDSAVSTTASEAFAAALRRAGIRIQTASDTLHLRHVTLAELQIERTGTAHGRVTIEQCEPSLRSFTWWSAHLNFRFVRAGTRWRLRAPSSVTVADGFCDR